MCLLGIDVSSHSHVSKSVRVRATCVVCSSKARMEKKVNDDTINVPLCAISISLCI